MAYRKARDEKVRNGRWLRSAILGGALLILPASALAEPQEALPAGPKQLLSQAVGEDLDALAEIMAADRTAEEWRAHLGNEAPDIDEAGLDILAGYLALNMPVESAPDGDSAEIAIAALPEDGREMFLQSCHSCHGVADYYLLQDRDAEGWMEIFDAPYHRRLLTGDNERETFASYAADAMPITEADIPEEWRD